MRLNHRYTKPRDACQGRKRAGDDPAVVRIRVGEFRNVPVLPIGNCEDKHHLQCLRDMVYHSGIASFLDTRSEKRKRSSFKNLRTRLNKLNYHKVANRFVQIGKTLSVTGGIAILDCKTAKIPDGHGGRHGKMIAVLGVYTEEIRPEIIGYFFGLDTLINKVGLGKTDPY